MDFSTKVLAFCLVSANLLICASGGLLDLLLGGNEEAPEQGQFINNDRQDIQSDYPDYNIGTNKDLDTSTDYGNFQQQNIPNRPGNFEGQTPDNHQNQNYGSQEYDPNYNSDEELRMGTPNEPPLNTNQNVATQNTNFQNNKNIKSTSTPLSNSYAPNIAKPRMKKPASQKSNINNIQAYIKNNTSNSNQILSETSSINSSSKNSRNPVKNKIAKSTEQKSKNNNNNDSEGEVNSSGEINFKNVLKPITKRKFFFQAKPVLPKTNGTIDMETIYYVD